MRGLRRRSCFVYSATPNAEHAHRHHGATVSEADDCCGPAVVGRSLRGAVAAPGVSTYWVEKLDCATEENDVRSALKPLAGVRSLEFDLVARRVQVSHDLSSPEPIDAAIKALGMRPSLVVEAEGESPSRLLSRRTIVTAVAAGLLAVGSEVAVIAGADEQSMLVALLALAAIALGGRDTLRKGLQALRSLPMTMSLLMSVAVIGAIAIGQWCEAAVVIVFGVAEWIEAMSLVRRSERDPLTGRTRPGDDPDPGRRRVGRGVQQVRPLACGR